MKITLLENCEKSKQLVNLLSFLEVLYEEKYFGSLKAAMKKPEIKENALLESLPLLCTSKNVFINNYYLIIKYVCASSDNELLGKNLDTQILCDQFLLIVDKIDVLILNLEKNMENKETSETLKNEINKHFEKIESGLKYNTFMAGNFISYVDFIISFSYMKYKVFNPNVKFSNVSRVTKFIKGSGLEYVN